MFKSIFARYVCVFIAVVTLSFTFLSGFIAVRIGESSVEMNQKVIENSAKSIIRSFNSYMLLTEGGFDSLIRDQKDILQETINTEAANSNALIFITDAAGNVLLQGGENVSLPRKIPEKVMNEAIDKAQLGEYITSDLGGVFQKKRLNYVIPLEKEFTYNSQDITKSQVVGTIFISAASHGLEGFFSGTFKSILVAAVLVIIVTLCGFLVIHHNIIQPVLEMSRAAGRFARGDFSVRVPIQGRGEIAELSVAFNSMAQAMEDREKVHSGFIANISHDLRTPMTSIGGFVQNMLEGVIPPEKHNYYLQIILDEVHRLSRLVGTLLQTSKMSAGEHRYSFAPFDLCELGRRTLLSFEKGIDDKKLDVEFLCDQDRTFVNGDTDALHQVVYNLIDNAIKFAPQNGYLKIRVGLSGEKAFLSVENSGDGIPAEELPYVFDRFYKSDRSRGIDKTGMGLGLFIAKSVIQAHNEEIWVTSEYGSFCRFVFTLPLVNEKNVTKKSVKKTEL